MSNRLHRKNWHKKFKRQELRYVWSKIDKPYFFVGSELDYEGLPNIMKIMKRYLPW